MAYIGKSPQNGVRNRFVYAATQGQTAFTGADSDGKTLAISDQLYTDVYQNGVKLKLTTDWTASSTTVTLVNAASVSDVIEILSFDVFSVSDTVPASTGGAFAGGISATTGAFSGKITADAGIDIDNFNIDGTTIALSSGNLTLDVAGDIVLDAADNEIVFKSGGTQIGFVSMASSDLTIESVVSDKDIILRGNDGGSAITALTLDMSAAGLAIFNAGIALGGTGAANTLDDYEEGTWTPADNSGASMSLTVWEAFYTKIGRKVYIEIGFLIPSNSSSAVVSISGLPFAAKSGNDNTGGFTLVGTNSGRLDYWLVTRGASRFGCSTFNNVGAPNSSYSNKQIKLNGSYTVA